MKRLLSASLFPLLLLAALLAGAASVPALADSTSVARRHAVHLKISAPAPASTVGIEAYSDTTGAEVVEVDTLGTPSDDGDTLDDETAMAFGSFISHLDGSMGKTLVGGIFFVIVLFFVLVLLGIILLIIFMVRAIIRALRHKDPVPAAMVVPETVRVATPREIEARCWDRGVRHLFVGLGLLLASAFWTSGLLSGIAVLIMCYGAGKMFIVFSNGYIPARGLWKRQPEEERGKREEERGKREEEIGKSEPQPEPAAPEGMDIKEEEEGSSQE